MHSKNFIRKIGLLFSAVLLFTSGCGPRRVSPDPDPAVDIEIFYNADDGEFWDVYTYRVPLGESIEGAEDGAGEEKTVITLATAVGLGGGDSGEYDRLVEQFNRENEKYRVELRTCHYGEELGTMRDRMAVEMGAGGGPDLVTEDVFPVSQEIMDSGMLVDLTPYLEAGGMTREKYFPGYASAMSGERIYGVSMNQIAQGCWVDEAVLGDREPPEDLETLVDMLLEYPGHGSLLGPSVRSRYILKHLLEGSEDLWGMIDWEDHTCDFTVPLFSKVLEVTKRYREDGKKGYEPVMALYIVDMFQPSSETLSSYPGAVPIGFFFDDGAHYKYQVNTNTLMINANTENLEGAYAFLSYVLSKRGQSFSLEPVHKEIWEDRYQYWLDLIEKGTGYATLNEETRKEALEAYEDARFAPRRTEEILEIVYEVADSYFEGDKSKEEVIELIQNRVQLYLNENK